MKLRKYKALSEKQIEAKARKALKDKPIWKPQKGYKYLKDLDIGSGFRTSSGMAGVLIECSVNAKVIIGDIPHMSNEDKKFYLGRRTIAAQTEVKEIIV